VDSVISIWARSITARVPTEPPDRYRYTPRRDEPDPAPERRAGAHSPWPFLVAQRHAIYRRNWPACLRAEARGPPGDFPARAICAQLPQAAGVLGRPGEPAIFGHLHQHRLAAVQIHAGNPPAVIPCLRWGHPDYWWERMLGNFRHPPGSRWPAPNRIRQRWSGTRPGRDSPSRGVESTPGGLVGVPQFVPQLGAGVVGLGGHADGRERAVQPVAFQGQCRDERRTPG
jgi:hypothetical protein